MEAACSWTSVAEMIREDTAPAATYFLSPYLWSSVLLGKHRLSAGFVQRVPLRKKSPRSRFAQGRKSRSLIPELETNPAGFCFESSRDFSQYH